MAGEYLEGEAGYSGRPDHDFFSQGVLTLNFVDTNLEFLDQTSPGSLTPFLSQGIIIANDGGSDIEFSWDGSFVCGIVKPGEVLTFDHRHKRRAYLRGLAGGEAYRFWAW